MNLIEHEQTQAFFETYEAQLYQKWSTSPNFETREELYRLKITLDAFRIHLRKYQDTGKIEEFKLKMDQTGTE